MDQEVTQFGEVFGAAREYCALIDHAKPAEKAWLESLFRLLPRLHAAITAIQATRGNTALPVQIDVDERFELFSRLRAGLGERDSYWMEFDNGNAINSLHMSGSLADDLTDIYFDLKSGLELLPRVRPERVLRFWQRSYELHWGQHLVDAQRHLYALMTQQGFA